MVTTYDSAAPASGLAQPANGAIPDYQAQSIPTEYDDAALADGDQADEAATEDADAPFDFDSLDDDTRQYIENHYQTQFESAFNQRLAGAMSTRDRENNQLRGQLQGTVAELSAHQAALNRLMNWTAQKAQESGDELAFYQARDAALAELAGTKQQHDAIQQNAFTWAHQQHASVDDFLNQESLGPNGQRLFDPADPEIVAAKNAFLQAGYRDQSSRRPDGRFDAQLNAAAIQADRQIRALAKAKAQAGLMGLNQPAKQAKAKQSADAIANRKARGPQATGKSATGGARMTGDQAMAQAVEEHPTNKNLQYARSAIEIWKLIT